MKSLIQVIHKNGKYEYRKYKNIIINSINKLFCKNHKYESYTISEFIFTTNKTLCCKCGKEFSND